MKLGKNDVKVYGNQHGTFVKFSTKVAKELAKIYKIKDLDKACQKFIDEDFPKLFEEVKKNVK